jgi:hypothetical protein
VRYRPRYGSQPPEPPDLDPGISRLFRAMIELRLNDYLRPPKIRSTAHAYRAVAARRNQEEARAWFFEDVECEGVFSFTQVCLYLGWSPQYIRRGIRQAHERSLMGDPICVPIERAR